MNRFLIVLVLSGLAMSDLDAQTVVVRKRNVDTEQSSSTRQAPRTRRYYENNATTINLVSLTNQQFEIGYERRLTDIFSLEVGLGTNWGNALDANFEYLLSSYPTSFYTTGASSMGNNQFIVLKIHPQSNAMRNSPYIGFRGGRRQYFRSHGDNPKTQRTLMDTGIQLGYQVRSGEFWYADMYAYVNRLSTISDRVSVSQVYDPDTQQIIDVVDINPEVNEYAAGEAMTSTRPMLNLGFRLGFAF